MHLPLDPGVTALYGLNGVGKSWILRLMRSALTGVRAGEETADLHIRVRDPQATPRGGFATGLRDLLAAATDRQRGSLARLSQQFYGNADRTLLDAYEELSDRNISDDIWSHVAALIDATAFADPSGTKHPLTDEAREALYESADAGLFTLRALGTVDAPAWRVFIPLSRSQPLSKHVLGSAAQGWREFQAALQDPDVPERLNEVLETYRPLQLTQHGWDAVPYLARRPSTEQSLRWASWMNIPILPVREHLHHCPVWVVDHESNPDVSADTRTALNAAAYDPDVAPEDQVPLARAERGHIVLNPDMEAEARRIEAAARDALQAVLLDAPRVAFHWRSPDQWLRGNHPHWLYIEDDRGDWLPIETLSDAKRRWTVDAVRVALSPNDVPVVLLSDEPERGLHRLAERKLAGGLDAWSRQRNLCVVVATHSPMLLNSALARPTLVFRDGRGVTTVREVSLTLLGDLGAERSADELGLSVGDLTALMRLTVVVEGLHDEWVLAHLLRSTLDTCLAGTFPMHGGKRARSLAEAKLLYVGTDAPLLVILDNLAMEKVRDIWDRTTTSCAQGDLTAARQHIEPLLADAKQFGDEYLFLHQLAIQAIEWARMDRLHLHGLAYPDIICYLPIEHVLDKSGDNMEWDELISRWRADSPASHATNIKKWLVGKGLLPAQPLQDARIEAAALRAAVEGVPNHPDLVELAQVMRDLASSD